MGLVGNQGSTGQTKTSMLGTVNVLNTVSNASLLTLRGYVNSRYVTVLVDSGASANFMTRRMIKRGELRKRDVNVRLADGSERQVYGEVYKTIVIGMRFSENYYECKCAFKVMDLQSKYEIILGQTWLKEVNPQIDWAEGTITIQKADGSKILLFSNEYKPRVSLHPLTRMYNSQKTVSTVRAVGDVPENDLTRGTAKPMGGSIEPSGSESETNHKRKEAIEIEEISGR